jgi:hypothetical protein
MQENDINEPDTIFIRFAAGLPITVQSVVLARCCIGLGLLEARPGQDHLATLRSALGADTQIVRPYKVALLSGIMELALEHEEGDPAYLSKLAKDHPDVDSFERMALQAPLKDKHWQIAREQFAELRAGILSSQALRAWQKYLMVKYPGTDAIISKSGYS